MRVASRSSLCGRNSFDGNSEMITQVEESGNLLFASRYLWIVRNKRARALCIQYGNSIGAPIFNSGLLRAEGPGSKWDRNDGLEPPKTEYFIGSVAMKY